MSIRTIIGADDFYVCDKCGREEIEEIDSEGWGLMPLYWIHTMDGRDLCQWCQR